MRKMGVRLGSILSIYWQESVQRFLHGVASMLELCFSQKGIYMILLRARLEQKNSQVESTAPQPLTAQKALEQSHQSGLCSFIFRVQL